MTNISEKLHQEAKRLTSRYLELPLDSKTLIKNSVGSSTIRAFRANSGDYIKYKPLSIYRTWAQDFLNENMINAVKARNHYSIIRNQALEILEKYWVSTDGGKPKFYQFNKLLDLFFKFLPRWNELDSDSQLWLFNNAHVPLDTYSLKKLRENSTEIIIKPNATMSFVTDKKLYDDIQDEIKRLCGDYPPILFDLIAWDNKENNNAPFKLIKANKNN